MIKKIVIPKVLIPGIVFGALPDSPMKRFYLNAIQDAQLKQLEDDQRKPYEKVDSEVD